MVCNGGSNHLMQVEEVEETVQQRMIKLMIETNDLSQPMSADKIIDFEMLSSLIDQLSESILKDLDQQSPYIVQEQGSPRLSKAEQSQALVTKLLVISDLYQIVACSNKNNEIDTRKRNNFFELYEAMLDHLTEA